MSLETPAVVFAAVAAVERGVPEWTASWTSCATSRACSWTLSGMFVVMSRTVAGRRSFKKQPLECLERRETCEPIWGVKRSPVRPIDDLGKQSAIASSIFVTLGI